MSDQRLKNIAGAGGYTYDGSDNDKDDEENLDEGVLGVGLGLAKPLIPAIGVAALIKKLFFPKKKRKLSGIDLDKLRIGDRVKVYNKNGVEDTSGVVTAVDTDNKLVKLQSTRGLVNVDSNNFNIVKE